MKSCIRFLTFSVFVFLIAHGCKQHDKTPLPVTIRDTTIGIKEAFSTYTIDSGVVYKYLAEHPRMSDTAKQLFLNFYNSRNFQYAWFDDHGITEHAGMLWNLFQQYIEFTGESIHSDSAFYEEIKNILSGETQVLGNAEIVLAAELNLTRLFFDYAFAAYIGTTDPEELQWYIPRKKINVLTLLDSVLKSSNSSTHDWEPVNQQYKLLRKNLVYLSQLQKAGGWPTIDSLNFTKLEKGSKDKRVQQIKDRLYAIGSYPANERSMIFSKRLEDSIKVIQELFGLAPDGIVGKATIEALNIPVELRIQQLLINIERLRWLPSQPTGDWIVANIPSFTLRVFHDSTRVMKMKIVVGSAATRTVIFSDELKFIVFSPYWNVPASIVRNEILPALNKNPNYLKTMHMEITGRSGGLPVIRQRPGPDNALGKVKFLFPNSYNIYLHDTPAKSFFSEQNRAFSHGCIRLGSPYLLTKYLLRNDSTWTDASIKKAMNSPTETWVKMNPHIPVLLTYFTAWVNEEGRLEFRNDVYGHDQRMATHLFAD